MSDRHLLIGEMTVCLETAPTPIEHACMCTNYNDIIIKNFVSTLLLVMMGCVHHAPL